MTASEPTSVLQEASSRLWLPPHPLSQSRVRPPEAAPDAPVRMRHSRRIQVPRSSLAHTSRMTGVTSSMPAASMESVWVTKQKPICIGCVNYPNLTWLLSEGRGLGWNLHQFASLDHNLHQVPSKFVRRVQCRHRVRRRKKRRVRRRNKNIGQAVQCHLQRLHQSMPKLAMCHLPRDSLPDPHRHPH